MLILFYYFIIFGVRPNVDYLKSVLKIFSYSLKIEANASHGVPIQIFNLKINTNDKDNVF
ncbi:hypothetical protein BSF42_02930 [Flavobacterium sp. ACN6]|nr:hypothetical protein BSF42_02930 [Flavobacterium sp. ACN6]